MTEKLLVDYDPQPAVKQIPLTMGMFALVDYEDLGSFVDRAYD